MCMTSSFFESFLHACVVLQQNIIIVAERCWQKHFCLSYHCKCKYNWLNKSEMFASILLKILSVRLGEYLISKASKSLKLRSLVFESVSSLRGLWILPTAKNMHASL